MEGEVHQLKDNLLHQRKRAAENMMSLLKDLNEIGTMFSHDLDLKVRTRRMHAPTALLSRHVMAIAVALSAKRFFFVFVFVTTCTSLRFIIYNHCKK